MIPNIPDQGDERPWNAVMSATYSTGATPHPGAGLSIFAPAVCKPSFTAWLGDITETLHDPFNEVSHD